MYRSPNNKFVLILTFIFGAHFLSLLQPVFSGVIHRKIPLSISALQNPNLFGSNIFGYASFKRGYRFRSVKSTGDIQLWPNGMIPFVIDSALEKNITIILKAMQNYYENTCIKFIPRSIEYDFVNITYGDGCYSENVGRLGGMQIVSLGNECLFVGTIVHELGHAVGLFHEHQRSDRDKFIKVNEENVMGNRAYQFQTIKPNENELTRKYDYYSIMHYGATAFSRSKDITMVPKQKGVTLLEVKDKDGLSQADIKLVKRLYNCS